MVISVYFCLFANSKIVVASNLSAASPPCRNGYLLILCHSNVSSGHTATVTT
jgi:hypothetical protein